MTRQASVYALLAVFSVLSCARARPPTTLTGPPQTNATDRALAQIIALAWSTWDELDPVTRDEQGVAGGPRVWPPPTPQARSAVAARLDPVRARLARIDLDTLSPPWRATHALLRRRLEQPSPSWDALDVQLIVGRGLWAAIGPQAWPAARGTDRLEALGQFVSAARTATIATSKERLVEAVRQLRAQRKWIDRLEPVDDANVELVNHRDLAVASLDVHEMRLQDDLLDPTVGATVAVERPWTGRWPRVPGPSDLEAAADLALARVQDRLLDLTNEPRDAAAPIARARRLSLADPPAGPVPGLERFLATVADVLTPGCPPPPAMTATIAPASIRGLAVVRLDEVQARTSTTTYRLWLSTKDAAIFRELYPPPKQLALALYEGWPGRALRHWATRTRADRGLMERRWPDPVLAAGWPLFALDRLLARASLPDAVEWHVDRLLLRAIADAQVDLRMQRTPPPDDADLLRWLTEVGGQTPAEAQYKLDVARAFPGRLTAPLLGWLTLAQLADAHLASPPSSEEIRRLAGCSEWPPDLLPACLASTP